jgi:Mg/Co/Ni transporter MgtE
MTDFRVTASITVPQSVPIDEALEHMRHTGVRCAFAIDEARRSVVGMITAYDIMGEQPMRHMQAASMPRRDVLVWHLMRRTADWSVLGYEDVARATVIEVARLFDDLGLTHLPVMATNEDGARRLRGLLSAAKIRRLLRS